LHTVHPDSLQAPLLSKGIATGRASKGRGFAEAGLEMAHRTMDASDELSCRLERMERGRSDEQGRLVGMERRSGVKGKGERRQDTAVTGCRVILLPKT
jgi:hypothetical protein